MGCEVYANGNTIACKVADGKTVAAMPDVCLSPPSPPAGPVPIPYPNTAMASDTSDGSKTVQIGGQEVMLKDKSSFKKSSGDEAATKSLGMGVVAHQIQGKVNFVAWSMDVKFEEENIPRHLDPTLHNEMSVPSNTGPWPYIDAVSVSVDHPCAKDMEKEQAACGGKSRADQCKDPDCQTAQKCRLVAYGGSGSPNCCEPTAHHLVEVHCFAPVGARQSVMPEFKGYNLNKAPCVCASGPRHDKQHGTLHAVQGQLERAFNSRSNAPNTPLSSGVSNWTYEEARSSGVMAHRLTFPGCNPDCIAQQLDNYHKQAPPDGPGVSDKTPIRSDLVKRSEGTLTASQQSEIAVAQAFISASGL